MLGRPSHRTEKHLKESGTRAPAVVTAIADRGVAITDGAEGVVGNTTLMRRTSLRVEPIGEPAFEIEKRFRYSQFGVPSAGDKVAVIFDPEDHDSIMIDHDTVIVPAVSPLAKFDGSGMVIDRGGGSGIAAPAPAAPAPPDALDRLERLVTLHEQGALTDAEFAAEKAKILGETT